MRVAAGRRLRARCSPRPRRRRRCRARRTRTRGRSTAACSRWRSSGDTLYLGGDFTYLGPRTGPLALLDGDGAVSRLPALDNGFVNARRADGAGGWYVGGVLHVDRRRRASRTSRTCSRTDRSTRTSRPRLDTEVSALAVLGGRRRTSPASFTRRAGRVRARRDGVTAGDPAPVGNVHRARGARRRRSTSAAASRRSPASRGGPGLVQRRRADRLDPALDRTGVSALATSASRLYVVRATSATVDGQPRARSWPPSRSPTARLTPAGRRPRTATSRSSSTPRRTTRSTSRAAT